MSKPLTDPQIAAIAKTEGLDVGTVRTISNAAVAHDVEPTLLLAVAKRETDFGRGPGYDKATGRGDGGHGYGMFQLDDGTPSHGPLLARVQHDVGAAADIAASMLHETLAGGGSAADAAHMYNSGSLTRATTTGLYEGRTVSYETAVLNWAQKYERVAQGQERSQGSETHPAADSRPATAADQRFVNERVAEAAERFRGMSTRDAQTHTPALEDGNVACAYAVNKVLDAALGRTYGENQLGVSSVTKDLLKHGHEVSAADARPGDIAIRVAASGETHGHIGIVTRGGENTRILSNSSSRASFTSEESPSQFAQYHHHADRVKFIRIDPASVDLDYAKTHPVPEHPLGPGNAPPSPTRWDEHRPDRAGHGREDHTSHGRDEHATAKPAARHVGDAATRNDTVIHGEYRNGKLVESPAELARKNEIVAEAIRDAKAGKTLDFKFVGNGSESGREVALQNEKLQHAIETHLPRDAKVQFVEPDERSSPASEPGIVDRAKHALASVEHKVEGVVKESVAAVKQWTPDMPFDQFAKLMNQVRGGPAQEPATPRGQERAQPDHAVDRGR